MLLILLLAIYFLLFLISYILLKKEIIQPSVILTAVYTFSIFFAVLNIKAWNINYSLKAFLILALGGSEFVLISYIIHRYFYKKNVCNYSENGNKNNEDKVVNISIFYILAIIFYNIITLILLYKNVVSIASQFGSFDSFKEALTLFKNHTAYSNDAKLPQYMTMMIKPVMAAAYIFGFLFINNWFYSKDSKVKIIIKYGIYLIFPLMFFVEKYLESSRGPMLNYLLGMATIGFIVWYEKNDWNIKIKIINLIKMLILIIGGLILFYYSASIVGRINTKNMKDYISLYVGGSIECFNQYIKGNDYIEAVRGEYTFTNTIYDLNWLGITNINLVNNNISKFIYYQGQMVGNVYTAYRAWLHDYGIFGVVIFQGILAIVINVLYNIVRYMSNYKRNLHNFLIIFYGYLIYTIYMHSMDSYFYLEFFTKSTMMFLVILIGMYYILTFDKSRKDRLKGGQN